MQLNNLAVKGLTLILLSHFKSVLLGHQITAIGNKMGVDLSIIVNVSYEIKQIIMTNFQPLEVVNRGSETQPQVVENLNKLLSRIRVKKRFNTVYIRSQQHKG